MQIYLSRHQVVNLLSHYTTKCNEHFLQSFRCLTMNHF